MAAPPPERTVKQAKVAEAPRAAAGEARSEAIGLPDVTERDQLEAWLRRQPPEVSVAIAARAALRTVPMIAAEFEPGKRPADEIATSILLPVFQHTAVAWAAAKFLSRSDSLAGDSPFAVAAQAVRATAATETDTALAITAAIAALNALAAAKVATKGTTGRDDAARYAASAADAVEYSEKAYTVDGGFPRGSLNSDLERIASGATAAELAGEPLWPEGVSFGISQAWERLKETLLSLDEGWEVWTDWYEARLEGRPANEELEVARATIPDEIWRQGPKVVNVHIRELIARHGGETPEAPPRGDEQETVAQEQEPKAAAEEGEAAGAGEIVFIGDAPVRDEDFLGRAELAFILAARLNRVWDEMNGRAAGESAYDAGFVVHIDAPWGGGKTSFANYLARILNPYAAAGPLPDWLKSLPLADENYWPQAFRRPWHIVSFNAWQHQHVDPPWWCFYQAIRKQACSALLRETNAQDGNAGVPAPEPAFGYRGPLRRSWDWLAGWAREFAWRLLTPKNLILMAVAIPTLLVALYGYESGWFTAEGKPLAFVAAVATLLTGTLSFVWAAFSTLTTSLVPGTPDAARNYSLGGGDPLERFRRHFARMMQRLRRPVLVIVDDIDRCEPRFVVELVRGMQTILKSPRVVFVLLGDRDWVEHSFAETHKAMKDIPVGPEHSFGGRFVEKAIQLSLMLPDVPADERSAYVQSLLGVAGAAADPVGTLEEDQRAEVEISLAALDEEADPVARDESAKRLREQVYSFSASADLKEAVAKAIDRKVALRSAADDKVQAATRHRLEPIARVLPANPRQIKRIINAISLFQEIARIRMEVQPETQGWRQLALWIVLMTEWPQTWATLATWPELVARVHDPDDRRAIAGLDEPTAQAWADAIRANPEVMALLDFPARGAGAGSGVPDEWRDAKLDAEAARRLTAILPPISGAKLPQPKAGDQSKGAEEKSGKRPQKTASRRKKPAKKRSPSAPRPATAAPPA